MPDRREKVTATVLSDADWDARVAEAVAEMPFAQRCWLTLGLAVAPHLRFVPTALRWDQTGEVLVPLCVSREGAQIGCYGYGSALASADWREERLPDFAVLADAVRTVSGVATLSTLVPPVTAFAAVDRRIGHWPSQMCRTTYLLDTSAGADAVWAAAKGRSRTAVRSAWSHGLTATPARLSDGPELLRLHAETLGRQGIRSSYRDEDVAFLLAEGQALTTVVAQDDGLRAVSVFALGLAGAFHIMQLTDERGRAANAGHLAFWAGVSELAESGIEQIDLGAAAGRGQEDFKLGWGAVAAQARFVSWPAGEAS